MMAEVLWSCTRTLVLVINQSLLNCFRFVVCTDFHLLSENIV
jgi:hypothetical protein